MQCHLLFWAYIWSAEFTSWRQENICVYVRWLLGDSGISFFVLFTVSVVSGLELMINSTSFISITRNSSFNECLCGFNNSCKMDCAEWVWHSPTPPIWEAPGWLVYHKTQSAPFSCRKVFIFLCLIFLNALFNSLLAPTKFGSLFDHIEKTRPLLDMIKESTSSELVTSICTVYLEKQVKRTV